MMNFQSVNPLNMRINLLSGNLLPITDYDSSYSLLWKFYSILVWTIQVITIISLIVGSMYVSTEKLLKDSLICFVITGEIAFMIMRIHARRDLIRPLIRQMNDILYAADKSMKNIVTETMKSVEAPLKFYLIAGVISLILWCSMPFILTAERSLFWYEDYRIPLAFSDQPFSLRTFVLGNVFVFISTTYMFVKKVGVDVYMIHLVLMMTTQYRYTAVKLAMIFHEEEEHSDINGARNRCSLERNRRKKREVVALCRRHNAVIQLTVLLKKILSTNFSFIYVNSVFRFCFLGIMLSNVQTILLEGMPIFIYISGAIVQLYILCSCVQQLLSASIEVTNKAFHEAWYLLETSIKRIFMMMIMTNNLECRLAKIENFNLSLPSFMTILNQAYSVALVFLRMK